MDNFIKIRNRLLAEKVIKGLRSRNMTGYFAETKDDALKIALDLLYEGCSISWGGSMSIREIGLMNAVLEGNYTLYNRDTCTSPEERRQVELAAFGADFYLCSTNAITEDGMLINIDGNANRVAAIAYGPRHILMIVGMNKVAKDEEHAMLRARNTAATTNTQRFPITVPCKENGSCINCKSKDTICCQFLTTRFSRHSDRFHIILVNEDLGF